MKTFLNSIRLFAIEDDGVEIVEYALIIAVISIMLVIAIRDITGTRFSGFINRVEVCLMTATCL